MKRIILLLLTMLLAIGSTACAGSSVNTVGSNTKAGTSGSTTSPASAESTGSTVPDGAATEPSASGKTVLVVVFSATGTTLRVAEKIAAIENADLYEIQAAIPYSSADLNWNDSNSRSTKEQNDKSARPEIGSERISLAGYTKIYVGFPIWWGEEPRIMDTFAESYDFDGITLIPFCTSSSSGIGRSGKNLAENAKSGRWLDGKRLGGNATDAELRSWIEGLQ